MADFAAQRRRHERERQARLKKKKSQRRSSSKKTVIYNASGKVTFSNDPRIKVGSVNESKVRTSSLSKTPSYRGASVVYKRNGAKITESVHRGGKVVSSRVVQDKSTPKSRRTTTTQLASQVRGVKSAQEKRYSASKLTSTRKKLASSSFGFGTRVSSTESFGRKPVLTVGKLLAMRGVSPTQSIDYTLYKNDSGAVIGIRDSFTQKSYRISPTVERLIKEQLTEQQLEKELGQSRRLKFEEQKRKIKADFDYWDDLDKQVKKIEKRSANSGARREAIRSYANKQLDRLTDTQQNLADKLKIGFLTKKSSSFQKSFTNKFVSEILTLPYDLTLGLGELGGQVADKTFFIIKRGLDPRTIEMAWEEMAKATLQAPREVAKGYDIRTPQGLANLVVTLAFIRIGAKKGASTYETLPRSGSKSARSLRYGSVVTDGKAVKIVGRGGKLKTVNNVLARRTLAKMGINSKTVNFKIKSIVKDKSGVVRITSAKGKVFKYSGKQASRILKANKRGEYLRVKRTEVARLSKKVLKEPLKKKEAGILTRASELKLKKQITKDINRLSRKYKLTGAEKTKFSKLYNKLKTNPTKKVIKDFSKFSDLAEVNRIVKAIDKKITAKLKVKPKVEAPKVAKKGLTLKEKLANFRRFKKKKITAKEYLKENKVKVKKLDTPEQYFSTLKKEAPSLYRDLMKSFNSRTEKFNSMFMGWTNGESVYIVTDKLRNKFGFPKGFDRTLRHEAFHVLKKDPLKASKIIKVLPKKFRTYNLSKKVDKLISPYIEFRTVRAETRFVGKFPSKVKVDTVALKYKKAGVTLTKAKQFQAKVRKNLRKVKATSSELKKASKIADDVLLKKKGSVKKLESFVKKIKSRATKVKQKVAISKADRLAQGKGYKNYKEQFAYEQVFKEYKRGSVKAGKKLSKIEKSMLKRKTKLSNQRAKLIAEQKKAVLRDANELLRSGRIKVKDKIYTTTRTRKALTKTEANSIAISVKARYNKLEDIGYKRQAKEVLKDIIEGKRVGIEDPKLSSYVRRLLNKEQLQLLRQEKLLRIKAGLVKGKQPKVSLPRAKKTEIKSTYKKQIADLKQKSINANKRRQQLDASLRKSEKMFRLKQEPKRGLSKSKRKQYIKEVKEAKIRLRRDMVEANKRKQQLDASLRKSEKMFKLKQEPKSRTSKLKRKEYIKKEEVILRKLIEGDPNFTSKYDLYINPKGRTTYIPKKIIPRKLRVKTATEVVKKSKLKSTDVKTGKDGTIQVLKTKKVVETKLSPLEQIGIKKAELKRIWDKIGKKKIKRTPRPRAKRIIGKVSKKPITGKVKAKIKFKAPKLVSISFSTVNASTISLGNKTSKLSKQANGVLRKLADKQTVAQVNKLKKISEIASVVKSDLDKVLDVAIKSDVVLKQRQNVVSKQKQVLELIEKIKSKTRVKAKKRERKPIKIKLPKFSWDKKPPKGKTYLVDVIVKSRGRVRKLAVKTTPNRALKLGANYVDNKLIRALDIKIIGYTSKKDIKAIGLPKFRTRKTKNTLRLVEKVKYALDRPTEKRNLRRARATKKAKRRVKKKVVRRKKRKV